ncbi:MAG: hypothetical protein HY814_05395 [Candidatus Riflebacteria bacterium]|nr:hypothetical protein [Candidatus Riflebacteria bacterium]
MIAITIQVLLGLAALIAGSLCASSSPSASRPLAWVRSCVAAVMGEEFHVADWVIGVFYILLGLFALFNAFMKFGAVYGFWVV